MKIWRTKIWSPIDIACLKWSCIFFGMIAGSFLSDCIREYLWFFVIAMLLIAIGPVITYFGNGK